jgi:hypothetical protein
MAKFNIPGWETDKTRREARVAAGCCPMCGGSKRASDKYDKPECEANDAKGLASQEDAT